MVVSQVPMTTQPRISAGMGALGAGSIVLAWAIGICGTMGESSIADPFVPVSRFFTQAFGLPQYTTLLILPGAIVLTVILLFCHGAIILPRLPRDAWSVWMAATALGAMLSWLLTWVIFFSQGQAWWRTQIDPPSTSRDLATFAYFIAVAIIGGISGGLVLGGLQWLVLRRYVAHAGWWILATISGTTILITMFAM